MFGRAAIRLGIGPHSSVRSSLFSTTTPRDWPGKNVSEMIYFVSPEILTQSINQPHALLSPSQRCQGCDRNIWHWKHHDVLPIDWPDRQTETERDIGRETERGSWWWYWLVENEIIWWQSVTLWYVRRAVSQLMDAVTTAPTNQPYASPVTADCVQFNTAPRQADTDMPWCHCTDGPRYTVLDDTTSVRRYTAVVWTLWCRIAVLMNDSWSE